MAAARQQSARVLVALGAAVLLAFLLLRAEHVEVVALEAVPVYDTLDVSTKKQIAVLYPHARVEVIACHDLKHYEVPEVRLADKRIGFVFEGNIRLVRTPLLKHFTWSVTVSC